FAYYTYYRGPGGVILPTSFSQRSTPNFHALWPDLKRLRAEDARDIANGLQELANSINPFPCTHVDDQGNLSPSINFSSCALPILLHAYAIHSATRGPKPGGAPEVEERPGGRAPESEPARPGNTLAEVATEGGHSVRIGKGGLV